MARNRGGGIKGPGGFIVSAFLMLAIGILVFTVGKANNINSTESLIDWTRSTSDGLKGCLEPDVKFWSCSFTGGGPLSPGGGSGSSEGSDGAGSGEAAGTPSVPGAQPGAGGGGAAAPGEQAASASLGKLAALKVGDPQEVDYDRGQWKHWIGDRCNDTRQQVLREQARSFELDGEGCRVASGEWIDPYTGETFTDPSKLDIDHVYALGAAAKNGGNGWDSARKQEFANDKDHLLAVSASANRSKSDRNPAEWWPENEAYSCDFATTYVDIATKYSLQFSKADVKALEKGLKTCG